MKNPNFKIQNPNKIQNPIRQLADKFQNFGFTLIELLVVISIIGILASLTLASYSGAQKQTRDTQRKSDLNQYRNALENYAAANNGLYPLMTTPNTVDNICGSGKPLDSKFIASCPDDPISTQDYYYGSSSDQTRYVLYTDLETLGSAVNRGFWYICSTGKTGTKNSYPTISNCP